MKRRMYITTMGNFSISIDDRPVPLRMSPLSLELFCSLLSPFDDVQGWDRLEAVISRHGMGGRQELVREIFEISACFIRVAGIDPLLMNDEGVSIDHRQVRVDAQEVVESVTAALDCMKRGDTECGISHAARALTLARAPFLTGMRGKIIDRTREELEDLLSLIRSNRQKKVPAARRRVLPGASHHRPMGVSSP